MSSRWVSAAITLMLMSGASQAQDSAKQQFIASIDNSLDQIIGSYEGAARPNLSVSANLFLAHGAFISSFPIDAVKAYADGLKDAGAVRIDMVPTLSAWTNMSAPQSQLTIAQYDALIAHVRELGLQVALNPTYIPGVDPAIRSQTDLQSSALQAYTELARRYKPDVFSVLHEPSTMSMRLGFFVSPQQWREYARTLAQAIKQQSPGTRCSAGFLPTEMSEFTEVLTVPELDAVAMNVYSPAQLDTYVSMASLAKQAGKAMYIEETWHPAYPPPGPGLPVTQAAGGSAGDPEFMALDSKWLTAWTYFASALGLETVSPFWTQTFFTYATSGDMNGLSLTYNTETAQAALNGARTPTFRMFQQLNVQWGNQAPVSVSAASFRGPLSGDSIASAFAPNLASGTVAATSLPLPTMLGGVRVKIRDSLSVARDAQMFFVSPTQLNYLVPAGTAAGPATVEVETSAGDLRTGATFIEPVAPALFAANSSGQGVAAAVAVKASPGGGQTSQIIFECPSGVGSCVPVPIDLGSETDQAFLLLFGTGIRGRSALTAVSAKLGGKNIPVQYAGPQGQFVGLDQVNIEIPRSLVGAGVVNIVLTVDGKQANVVSAQIQ